MLKSLKNKKVHETPKSLNALNCFKENVETLLGPLKGS